MRSEVETRRDPRIDCPRTRRRPAKASTGSLADLDRVIVPGLTHWQPPRRCFGYFPANSSDRGCWATCWRRVWACRGCSGAPRRPRPSWRPTFLDWLAEPLDLPARLRSTSVRRRRDPAQCVRRGPGRVAGGPAPGERAAPLSAVASVPADTPSTPPTRRIRRWRRRAGWPASARTLLRKLDVDPATMAARPEHLRALLESDRAAATHRRWWWRRSERPGPAPSTQSASWPRWPT